MPRGQGFRCEEAPRDEGAVVAIDIDDEDLKANSMNFEGREEI